MIGKRFKAEYICTCATGQNVNSCTSNKGVSEDSTNNRLSSTSTIDSDCVGDCCQRCSGHKDPGGVDIGRTSKGQLGQVSRTRTYRCNYQSGNCCCCCLGNSDCLTSKLRTKESRIAARSYNDLLNAYQGTTRSASGC